MNNIFTTNELKILNEVKVDIFKIENIYRTYINIMYTITLKLSIIKLKYNNINIVIKSIIIFKQVLCFLAFSMIFHWFPSLFFLAELSQKING